MAIAIEQFTCRSDNFGALVHDAASGASALVDAPEEGPILSAIAASGWRPGHLLITHHHHDHVAANEALKARFGLTIYGPAAEAERIPGIDRGLRDGDRFDLCGEEVHVIATPGHTSGHIVYHFTGSGVLFAADTLFSLGCGRVLEEPMATMHASLERLKALPPQTLVYCGHEYTESNARFALSVDPDNAALKARAAEVAALRAEGKPTLPVRLADELKTNPFLRCGDAAIRRHLGMERASDSEVFERLRKMKDAF